jgi:hypothetical protein
VTQQAKKRIKRYLVLVLAFSAVYYPLSLVHAVFSVSWGHQRPWLENGVFFFFHRPLAGHEHLFGYTLVNAFAWSTVLYRLLIALKRVCTHS